MSLSKTQNTILKTLEEQIKEVIITSRIKVFKQINNELLLTYWKIGKIIVVQEKGNDLDEQTARSLILDLSKRLTTLLGKGFSRSNLFNMRRFYMYYTDVQTLSGHLSWSHNCELISLEDADKRIFY